MNKGSPTIPLTGQRGVLMICDPRLISKPYGGRIWQSLPPMNCTRDGVEAVRFFNHPKQGV